MNTCSHSFDTELHIFLVAFSCHWLLFLLEFLLPSTIKLSSQFSKKRRSNHTFSFNIVLKISFSSLIESIWNEFLFAKDVLKKQSAKKKRIPSQTTTIKWNTFSNKHMLDARNIFWIPQFFTMSTMTFVSLKKM